jgi:hypothetical protein
MIFCAECALHCVSPCATKLLVVKRSIVALLPTSGMALQVNCESCPPSPFLLLLLGEILVLDT